jgi:methyl-accepting chemotaxis protein
MKISTRITLFLNIFLIACFTVLFIVKAKNAQTTSFEAEIDKARKIITMAEGTREYFSTMIHNGVLEVDRYKDDTEKLIQIVPVVSAMRIAEAKAGLTGMAFKVPKNQPRNPKNEPDEIDRKALAHLGNIDTRTGDTPEHIIYDEDRNVIRYYKAVRLTKECEWCHGDPSTSMALWGNDNGLDPTGVKMENWRAGEIHGAFEFMIPIQPINAAIRKVLFKDLIGLVFILIVLSVGTVVINRKIIFRPLKMVNDGLGDIASGNGDLTKYMVYNKKDELGDIATNFNKFLDYIRNMVMDVQDQAESMISSVGGLKNNVESISQGIEQQRVDSSALTAAVGEIDANIDSIADNSKDTYSKATITHKMAGKGDNAVRDMISKMEELTNTINESAHMVEALKHSTDKIGDIIEVINDIADQTNLLALNASIEAARAGDHGRGFAVVADEVRKLAERTQTATKEISGMILALQKESKQVAQDIVNTVTQAEEGGKIASVAGEALKEIIHNSEQSTNMAQHIQTATEEQSEAIGMITESTIKINNVADKNFESLLEISKEACDLHSRATSLTEKVRSFKTR